MDNGLTDQAVQTANNGVIRGLRYAAMIGIALIVVVANVIVFRQIDEQMMRSNTAETDSTPWVLSQVEVELLRYINALSNVERDVLDKDALAELRLRFDLLYSRTHLVASHNKLLGLPFTESSDWVSIVGPSGLIETAVPFFDGPDEALIPALPALFDQAQDVAAGIRKPIVQSMLISLRRLEDRRGELRSSLQVFSAVSLGLLGLLAAMMIALYLQGKTRERNRQELAQAVYNLRTTIDSSLEAAVILDHDGRVIGCNRAGAEMFGWEEGGRVVRYFSDVVREAKRGSAGLVEIAEACATVQGQDQQRITLTGYYQNGMSFPLELSLAQARSAVGLPIAIAFLRDISERVAQEETLRQARNAALQGEEAKSRFLAVMSHEMRTPLNGLLSAVELLTSDSKLDARQGRLVNIIETCGQTTLEQVNNVLELTRLQSTEGHSYPETDFDTKELVENTVAQFEAEARKRNNRFVIKSTGIEAPWLRGQRPLMARVLRNIVSNAVKFTDGGVITIAIDAQAGRASDTCALRISVTDTGVGIAPADRDRIFRAFETLDSSYARLKEGSGLGLGLAKLAAEAMGGRITVTSREGQGSTFALFLNLPTGTEQPPVEGVSTQTKRPINPLNVLVVEDNPVNRELLVELLQMKGHTVSEASDGAAGVEMAMAERPDIILMDISMPVMDGLEASRTIRAGGPSADVPIIGVTANADAEKKARFLEAGMTEVLSKPVNIGDLDRILQTIVPSSTDKITDLGATAPKATAPARLRLVIDREAEVDRRPTQEVQMPHIDLPPDLPALLDVDMLADLEDALGPAYMSRMANRFVAETNETLVAMQLSAQEGDLSGAAQLAHKNAGAAASLGLKALHRLLVVYENQAKAGDGGSAELTKAMIERIKHQSFDLLRDRGLTA
ncbi:MAG: response regulator [Rhodobacteraceae bacterium]|nr:response regulator [Paracoccaceae bacterium]MCF8513383.1 response regulator [Paracoccaceae bacterium]MCF8517717.1 response regulator [Paracoccaceae bacterium]